MSDMGGKIMNSSKNIGFFSGFPDRRFTDESAIFIRNGKVEIIGIIHQIEKGETGPFTEKNVRV